MSIRPFLPSIPFHPFQFLLSSLLSILTQTISFQQSDRIGHHRAVDTGNNNPWFDSIDGIHHPRVLPLAILPFQFGFLVEQVIQNRRLTHEIHINTLKTLSSMVDMV